MGMFMPDDKFVDETKRQTGFNRYTQLIGRHFGDWFKLNAMTIIGLLPLAGAVLFGCGTTSILLTLPCAAVGGALSGPFLACMYDSLLRALRDDPMPWWQNYKKSWAQNWKGSLIPGAILGMMLGLFAFVGMMIWMASAVPSPATILLFVFSAMITVIVAQLYFTQLVLFQLAPAVRLRNILLFTIQYFWKVCGVGLLQIGYWALYVLFAPWTLLILPIIGIWYILFLSELLLYPQLDNALRIEEQFEEAEI